MKGRRGFTLVELVMVIVLTLILTSVSIKGLQGITAWRSAAAVQRVQADVLYARNQALLSTRRTVCVFDPSSHTYEIQQEAAPGSGGRKPFLRVARPQCRTVEKIRIAAAE